MKKIVKKSVKKLAIKKSVKLVEKPLVEKPIESLYSLSLKIGENTYETQGDTILECIQKLKPLTWKLNGYIVLTSGEKRAERFLPVFKMKQIFRGNKFHKMILSKLLRMLLK